MLSLILCISAIVVWLTLRFTTVAFEVFLPSLIPAVALTNPAGGSKNATTKVGSQQTEPCGTKTACENTACSAPCPASARNRVGVCVRREFYLVIVGYKLWSGTARMAMLLCAEKFRRTKRTTQSVVNRAPIDPAVGRRRIGQPKAGASSQGPNTYTAASANVVDAMARIRAARLQGLA